MISLVALMIAAQSAMPVQLASSQSADSGSGRMDQMVCQRRPVTGSRTRFTRICMTRQEWEAGRENLKRGMQDFTTQRMTNVPPPPTTESATPQ
jgi:hypothetical protein